MDLQAQLLNSLSAASLPPPSTSFLAQLVTSRSPPLPLVSLLATARSRLLSADLASSSILDHSRLQPLPQDISSSDAATVKQAKLLRDVHVQILDVENISASRWGRVEELEAIERGERTRGREIIRVTDADDDDVAATTAAGFEDEQQTAVGSVHSAGVTSRGHHGEEKRGGKNATHRLVLQDCKGTKIFALEARRIQDIDVGKTLIGEKMLLRAGTVVARGTVLLTPEHVLMLGGKVEAWHAAWMESRLARLKEMISYENRSG